MAQMEASHMRLPTSLPGHTHAAAFVHVSHLMGGVHQRGGRRAAHRAAHRGAVGPERSGRSILKLTSLCRCAGPQEAAFCVLRAMRHRGCNGISGRVFEHRDHTTRGTTLSRFAPWGARSTTPLGPTLPSLVTAREYRSYCDLLYVHQVPGHGWARRATSSRGRRHVKCSGRWLCSNQRRRLK